MHASKGVYVVWFVGKIVAIDAYLAQLTFRECLSNEDIVDEYDYSGNKYFAGAFLGINVKAELDFLYYGAAIKKMDIVYDKLWFFYYGFVWQNDGSKLTEFGQCYSSIEYELG